MSGHSAATREGPYVYEPWYKYGIGVLILEAIIAVSVSSYAIYMGLSGNAVNFKKVHTFQKPALTAPASTSAPAPAAPAAK